MNVTLTAVVLLTTAALCYAADAECKYRKTRKLALHWPDPSNCTRYYRCTNRSVKREVVCAEGKVYNAKTGKCSNNSEGLCKLTLAMPLDLTVNPCANETSGVYLAQPGYCRNFYICEQNQAYPQICDAGSRFNSTARTCVPDTNSECWQNKCVSERNGTYLPNESSCSSFYLCSAGEAIEQECGNGSYFNTTKRICLPDPDGQFCWENLCIGKRDGEFVQNIVDCYSYYVCVAGKPIQQYCPEDSYFDSAEIGCVPGKCLPNTTEIPTTDTTTSTTDCITESTEVTTPVTESACDCPGGYKEGELVPFPNYPENCDKYYECSNGKLEEKECGEGNRFNSALGVCEPDDDNICWPVVTTECPEVTTPVTEAACDCPGGYKEGELVPFPNYPENCDKYYECSNGKLEEKECGEGNRFNSALGVCEPDVDNICWPVVTTECPEVTTPVTESACDCPGGYKEGELVPFPNYPENCDKYYECSNGKLEEKECGEGNRFNSALGVCEPDVDNICWPVITTECPEVTTPVTEAACDCPGGYKEGELVPFPNYPENCDKYYECSNGKLEEKECGEGNRFNSALGVCEPDVDNICWPVITTECPEVTTPVTEAACDCPGGYKEGELVPFPNYPENCDKYYECSNGKLEEKECGEGNRFNSALGVCEPDVDNICWPVVTTECPEVTTPVTEAACDCPGGYKEGELVPFPNYPENCDKYYECSNGKLEEKECGEGNRFNSALGVCEPDVDNICWPVVTTECPEVTTPVTESACDCPGGYKEGELVPFPSYPENCDKYYVCLNGKLEEQECGEGNRFNSALGVCEPDVDNICWPVITTECPEVTTPVTEAACDCPGGYKEGALVPFPNYPENCDKYYECSNGKLEEKECGEGNRFNSALGVCEPDVENVCSRMNCDDENYNLVGRRNKRSVDRSSFNAKITASVSNNLESDCICPGGYKESELLPYPNFPENCDKYYICTDGRLQGRECGVGNYFDNNLGTCEPDVNNICWPSENNCTCPGGYKESELLPYPNFPENCDKYYICTDGRLQGRECGMGNYFNNNLGTCEPDVNNICWPAENNCTCPGGYKESELLPYPNFPENCDKYYICTDGRLQGRECGVGNYFDNNLGTCVPDVNNICWPNICNGQPDDTFLPDPTNCTSFYYCKGGKAELTDCPPEKWFNPSENICMPDYNASCINPCKDTTGATNLPNPDCSKYFFCNDGQPYIKTCPEGEGFDITLGYCHADAVCEATMCVGKSDGTTFPLVGNDTKFYLCIGGVAQIRECLSGVFNQAVGICLEQPSPQCDQSKCNSTNPEDNAFAPLTNIDNTAFCLCRGKSAFLHHCAANYTFQTDLGICESNAPCDPVLCDSFPDNTRSQNRNDSHSFCLCVGKQQVIVDCPNNQTYNAVTRTCQVLDERCSTTFCLTAPEYSTFPALNNDTDGFCECVSSGSIYKLCGNGKKYNVEKGICLADTGDVCSGSLCSGNIGLVFGTDSDPHSFCYCINDGFAIKETCPNSEIFNKDLLICQAEGCDGQICLTNPKGPFPALNEPYAFCLCESSDPSSVTKHPCVNGTRFDPNYLICKVDPCDKNFCSNLCNDGIPYPANNYPPGYCVCNAGIPELHSCSDGTLFNPISRQCGLPSNVDCEACQKCLMGLPKFLQYQGVSTTSCLGTYSEGEYVPHPTNNQLYYICYNAKLTEGDCGQGNVFDQYSQTCQPLTRGFKQQNKHIMRTKVKPEHNKWCIENESRYVLSNCSQYEMCIDGVWTRLSCSDGQFYSFEEQTCIERRDDMICISGRINKFPNCSISLELHTVTGNDVNCTQYYRCNHGKWRLKTCPKQHFYSNRLNTCIQSSHDDFCAAQNELDIDIMIVQETDCRHMDMRPYESNCAMYLMCLDGKWWHHYCPLGMFFNSTYNYCMPDLDGICSVASKPYSEQEYSKESCVLQGALRPSYLACDRYYVCQGSFWEMKMCSSHQYFNLIQGVCLPDVENVCLQQHKANCLEGERREFPFNCTAYEKCVDGVWQKQSCKSYFMFDNILHECVPNNGECAENGLRKVCESGAVRAHPFFDKCTQFFYCLKGIWKEGICLKGHTYLNDLAKCEPHSPHDKCQPFIEEQNAIIGMNLHAGQSTLGNNVSSLCLGRENGSAVPHPESCLHFFVCLGEVAVKEQKCTPGAFFDATLGYCRPNNGSCIMPLMGVCENSTDGGQVAHPFDCQAYYKCSVLNGTELRYCAEGEYYHNITAECHIDRGECRSKIKEHNKCTYDQHGKSLSHERYCNIYFACVRGLAIPVMCPADNHFNPNVGRCAFDVVSNCENGSLSEIINNFKSEGICKNLSDGIHLPDMTDCTKYYVCSAGLELKKECPLRAYFDAEQHLCVPDDGSCPYVVKEQPSILIVPPEPSVCEGKHGYMLPDPLNCNEFYVCINGKMRHERCYTNYYFNSSILQCQSYKQAIGNITETDAVNDDTHQLKLTQNLVQCKHKPSNYTELCLQMPKGSSIAEQGDCRRYISCSDVDDPVSLRCRNGESYDSLLGFCRQNDGTCLLENGQRVGECNARHGELVRDATNCKAYFVCINGQKIPGNCDQNEYFDKTQASCLPDGNNQCGKALNQAHAMKTPAMSCFGLSDSILYPYVQDNCRSYFQCIHGTPVVHKCADGLYFNASITRCVKDVVNCTMPAATPKQALENF